MANFDADTTTNYDGSFQMDFFDMYAKEPYVTAAVTDTAAANVLKMAACQEYSKWDTNNGIDPYLFACMGQGLTIAISVLGAAWCVQLTIVAAGTGSLAVAAAAVLCSG